MLCKTNVLGNFTKFTGKQLCHSHFFNKVSFFKKRLWHRCFPVNFAKFIRTPFFHRRPSVTASVPGQLFLCKLIPLFLSCRFPYSVGMKWNTITWNMSKCGVFSVLCFPVFRLNTWIYPVKYGPEKTPYSDSFHGVYRTKPCHFLIGYALNTNHCVNLVRKWICSAVNFSVFLLNTWKHEVVCFQASFTL